MASAVQRIKLSSSRDISFSKLVVSQSKVRRVKAGVSIEQLVESVAQCSLLQSLGVRAVVDTDGRETGLFEVPAGGRRYRALELLDKQKRIAKMQPIPCVVRDGSIAEDDNTILDLADGLQACPVNLLDITGLFSRPLKLATVLTTGQGRIADRMDRATETIFPDHEAVLKQTGCSLPSPNKRGSAMITTIINSIYRHFLTAAIVGMAVTQGTRR